MAGILHIGPSVLRSALSIRHSLSRVYLTAATLLTTTEAAVELSRSSRLLRLLLLDYSRGLSAVVVISHRGLSPVKINRSDDLTKKKS